NLELFTLPFLPKKEATVGSPCWGTQPTPMILRLRPAVSLISILPRCASVECIFLLQTSSALGRWPLRSRIRHNVTEPKYIKCSCQKCGGHIQFPAEGTGLTVACPHCGQKPTLATSKTAPAVESRAVEPDKTGVP